MILLKVNPVAIIRRRGIVTAISRFLMGLYRREPWLAEFVSSNIALAWGVIALTSPFRLDLRVGPRSSSIFAEPSQHQSN